MSSTQQNSKAARRRLEWAWVSSGPTGGQCVCNRPYVHLNDMRGIEAACQKSSAQYRLRPRRISKPMQCPRSTNQALIAHPGLKAIRSVDSNALLYFSCMFVSPIGKLLLSNGWLWTCCHTQPVTSRRTITKVGSESRSDMTTTGQAVATSEPHQVNTTAPALLGRGLPIKTPHSTANVSVR